MKHKISLTLAALGLSAMTSFAATLDIANLGGSFPTYVDNSGIVGLTITYSNVNDPGTSEGSGHSREAGRGMSLPVASFPNGHLAVGPGDTVTLDFTNVSESSVFIGFIDLDNNTIGGNEGVTVTSASGSQFIDGAPGQIQNTQAYLPANIFNVQVSPAADNTVVIQASTAGEQGGAGNGYFAFSVGTTPIPEPSTSFLGLLGLTFLAARRRR